MIDLTALDKDISSWQDEAACLTYPAVLVFGLDESESTVEKRSREEEAKSICSDCRVRSECLQHALDAREQYGIWGGLTELERRARSKRAARR
jgi:WhiB family redox-sensing transcriptional regulator